MANPLPLITFGVGTLLMGIAPFVDGQYIVSEFTAIVASTAIVAAATKFFRIAKTQEVHGRLLAAIHERLDKLEVPPSDSLSSGT